MPFSVTAGVAGLFMLLAMMVYPMDGDGQSMTDPVRISMLGSRATAHRDETTLAAVRAYLSGTDAVVAPIWLTEIPPPEVGVSLVDDLFEKKPVAAVFWQRERRLYIYMPSATSNALLVRDLGVGDEASFAHAIGLIVSNTVASILSGNPPETTADSPSASRDAPPGQPVPKTVSETKNSRAPSPPPEPTRNDGRSSTLEAAAVPSPRLLLLGAYNLDSLSTAAPVVHGGRFGVDVRVFLGLYATLAYTVSQPFDDKVPDLGAYALRHHPIDLGLRWLFSLGRWRLGVGAALTIDIVKETIRSEAEISAAESRTIGRYNLLAEATGGVRLVGPLFAVVHLGVRILTAKPRYTAEVADETVRLYDPWRFQPRLSVGVYVAFF